MFGAKFPLIQNQKENAVIDATDWYFNRHQEQQEQIAPEEWDDLMKTKAGSMGEKTYDRH